MILTTGRFIRFGTHILSLETHTHTQLKSEYFRSTMLKSIQKIKGRKKRGNGGIKYR